MGDELESSFLPKSKAADAASAQEAAELRRFRKGLKWMCLDQSNVWRAALSWSIFLLLFVVVPLFTHFFYVCPECDESHRHPYDAVVQLSLSAITSLSFVCLSRFASKYGLRRFLFIKRLSDDCGE